jgi:hypothetical protein
MRKFVIVLFLLLAVGGALGFYWWKEASKTKDTIERIVAQINTSSMQLTYSALDISGFPSHVIVSMRNPRISGRLDTLLNQMRGAGVEPVPEWQQDTSINGEIRFSIDLLSQRFVLNSIGGWKNRSVIKGKTIEFVSSPNGRGECAVEFVWSGIPTLWNIDALKRQELLAENFRLLDCSSTEDAYTDPNTNTMLAKNGPQRFYVSLSPDNGTQNIRFVVKSSNMEFSPEGDRIFGQFSEALSSGSSVLLSAYGNQSLDIDFSYTGPSEWKQTTGAAPLNIQLASFKYTSDVLNSNTTASFNGSGTPDNYSARIAFKSESIYSDIYNLLVQDIVRDTIRQIFAEKTHPKNAPSIFDRYTPESFYTLVSPAIPDFHGLAKTVAALDASYQGAQNFSAGDFTLATFEMSAASYGITGNGNAKRRPELPMPVANLAIKCANCLTLIDDMAGYANRVIEIITVMQPDASALPRVDKSTVEGYKGFLQALASPDSSTPDFSYAIISDGKGVITINGKPIDQVMMMMTQYLPPHAQAQ